ncbi:MAG: hypothetical protein RLY13_659 [Actinomycetota bacterium]
MDILLEALLALVPPVLVGLVFWVMMRGILRADSKERQVYAEIEAEMRAAQAAKKAPKVTKKTQN